MLVIAPSSWTDPPRSVLVSRRAVSLSPRRRPSHRQIAATRLQRSDEHFGSLSVTPSLFNFSLGWTTHVEERQPPANGRPQPGSRLKMGNMIGWHFGVRCHRTLHGGPLPAMAGPLRTLRTAQNPAMDGWAPRTRAAGPWDGRTGSCFPRFCAAAAGRQAGREAGETVDGPPLQRGGSGSTDVGEGWARSLLPQEG